MSLYLPSPDSDRIALRGARRARPSRLRSLLARRIVALATLSGWASFVGGGSVLSADEPGAAKVTAADPATADADAAAAAAESKRAAHATAPQERGVRTGSIVPLAPGAKIPRGDAPIRDLDGAERRLVDFASSKSIVLCWNAVGCPISKLSASHLESLAKRYADRGVTFLGVNSQRGDEVPAIRAFAKAHDLSFPILKDHDNDLADRLGARRTTEVFVLSPDLRLLYRGAVDDRYKLGSTATGIRKENAEREYLVEALDAILEGKEVPTATTEAAGCIIGRRTRGAVASNVTFHRDIEPILQNKCQSCHRSGQIAPFELKTFEDASSWAGMIGEVVENRRMPPWHANPEHGSFENDRRLTDDERETILAWVDADAPRGNPEDAPPAVEFSGEWQIGTPDAIFEMPKAYSVPATGSVRYQYFLLPTNFAEDRWVQAIEVLPGSRAVVHHVLVFVEDPKNRKAWRRETGGGVRGYFGAMVPGERPSVFPEGTAKRLPAGGTLIFQMHYTTNGTPAEDRSRIGLVFSRGEVRHEVKTRSVHETRLRIPPSTSDHTVHAYYPITHDAMLLSLLPHMHLRGSAFRYTAHLPITVSVSKDPWELQVSREMSRRLRYDSASRTLTWLGELGEKDYESLLAAFESDSDRKAIEKVRREAKSEILLDVPRYDFGWQNTYRLAEPKLLPKGTVIEAVAVFDNSSSNPALTRKQWESTVRWGEQTWEEMLIGYFDFYEPGTRVGDDAAERDADRSDDDGEDVELEGLDDRRADRAGD
jgi:peroxiredoxin